MLRIMPDLDIPSALAARFKLSPRWIIALLTSRSRKNAPLTPARHRRTIAALNSLDSSRILSFSDDYLDSPASIAVLMETMRLTGAGEFQLRENSNSSDLGGSALAPVTSYTYGYYR